VTTGTELGRHDPESPGVQKILAKRMKTGGLGAIRVWAKLCNQQKRKEMLRGVRNGQGRRRWRGGFSSNQPRET
jgi:hypothetical protein